MKDRKRILRYLFITLSIVLSVVFIPWGILSVWIAPLPETVEVEVENAIDHGLDGILVYVDQPGEDKLYSAGWKDRESQLSADPQALFKIGSISKLYIAVSATKLIDDQALSLDDTLADLLPELSERIENAKEITLQLMLQHRSGIPDYTDQPDYSWADSSKDNRERLEMVLDKPADFKPDKKYNYSNTNYLLIGEILDQTLGYSHHQYIKKEILIPLELKNTYSLLSEVNLEDVMSGYDVGYAEDLKSIDFINPGGSMVASAQDVGIFLRALNDGSLLTKDEQAIYSSVYEYEHTGLLPGYQSFARYHEDIDTVVVLFVNTSGGDTWTKGEIIYNRILKILRK